MSRGGGGGDLRTFWTRRGGVDLDRAKLEAEELAEAAELAERFVRDNVTYSVDEFELNLSEIERQVGTLAYLKGDNSIGGEAAASRAAAASAAAAAARERRKQARLAQRRSSIRELKAREERAALRKMKEAVVPKAMYTTASQADFDRFLQEQQLESREWIEDELEVRRGEEDTPDFNDYYSEGGKSTPPHVTLPSANTKIILPTLMVSTLSRNNLLSPLEPDNNNDNNNDGDEMILWTMRDSDRKSKK